MKLYPRNSRRAVHAIAQAPRYGYTCGVTENHVHNRSAGATADPERVTCEACANPRAPERRRAAAEPTCMDKTQPITFTAPATHDELGDLNYDRQRVPTNENGRTTRIPRMARPKLLQWIPTLGTR